MSKRRDKKRLQDAENTGSTAQAPISKDDLEDKFRQIKTEIDDVTQAAKGKAIPAAAAGGLLVILLMYLLGKRVGKKRSAVVQIRRI